MPNENGNNHPPSTTSDLEVNTDMEAPSQKKNQILQRTKLDYTLQSQFTTKVKK